MEIEVGGSKAGKLAGTGQNVTLPPPPPRQTRTRTPTPPESLERNPAKKARQEDGSSDSEGDYSSDQPEPADAYRESTDRERDSLQHTSSQPYGPQSGKQKVTTCTGTVHVRRHFTPEEEEELASWWEQETYLYNRALLDYKDTKKKDAAIAAKGRLMNRTGKSPAPIFLIAPAAHPGFFIAQSDRRPPPRHPHVLNVWFSHPFRTRKSRVSLKVILWGYSHILSDLSLILNMMFISGDPFHESHVGIPYFNDDVTKFNSPADGSILFHFRLLSQVTLNYTSL